MKIKNKRAQGMQFAWLFAIILGAFILFMAIFFSGKLVKTGTLQTEAEITRSLDVLLNPFASISQAQVSLSKPVSLPQQAEVNFSCNNATDSQQVSVRLKKGEPFFYTIRNKYIFAENFNAKEIWVFAKPFEMPWRVDDLIYVVSKNYCFVISNPNDKIGAEIRELNSSFIQVAIDKSACKANSVKVCFGGISTCNITVMMNEGSVTQSGRKLYFMDDATMYAAIFGPKQYECNLNRLMKRLSVQADIFTKKADLLASQGCAEAQNLRSDLISLKGATSIPLPEGIATLKYSASNVESKNRISCPIY